MNNTEAGVDSGVDSRPVIHLLNLPENIFRFFIFAVLFVRFPFHVDGLEVADQRRDAFFVVGMIGENESR